LIRAAWVLVAILATGLGFLRLTGSQVVEPAGNAVEDTGQKDQRLRARFVLTFSDRPAHVELASAGEVVSRTFSSESMENEIQGNLLIDPKEPVVLVKVDWYELGEKQGFVKMVLEVEGQPTITRVFDAAGNIDDFLEVAF
jgi:hypothetical protein